MAQGKDEQEFDEFKTLMFRGKFPSATSGKHETQEFRLNRLTSNEIPGNFKIMNNGFQRNHLGGVSMEELKQLDDQFLVSAFADWNLGSGLEKETLLLTNDISSSNPEHREGTLFSIQSQSGVPHAFNVLNGTNTGSRNTENYFSAGRLMNDRIGFVSDLSFPVDTQSSPPYSHPQHVNQSQFAWRNIEEELLYKTLEQRNLHLLQQHNRQFDTQKQIRANSSMVAGLMNQNQHYLQSYGIPQWLDCLSLNLPCGDFDSMHVHDKMSSESCPGSLPVNQSLNRLAQNGRFILNGQVCYNLFNSDQGFFHSGNLSPNIGQLPNRNGLSFSGVELLPQQYDCVDEVRGSIYRLAKDQNGCRYLQRRFLEGSPKEVEIIFGEVLKHVADLMTDPFGNYLVQKLLQVCDENQTSQILQEITWRPGDLIRISCDMHGTRAIQKVLQTLRNPQQFTMAVASLKPGMVILMKNTNGHHVAKSCLEYLAPKYREFLFEVAAKNCVDLATDRHGCCVLQKCLGHPGGEQRSRLIHEIATNSLIISQNQFGNYVVQYVLLNIPEAAPDVLNQLEGHYVELSMQKYSSNVVEKCMEYAGEECHRRIIRELITSPELDQIMQDPYGNYVIQAALNSSKGEVREAIVEAIKPHIHVLRTSPYGKKVLSSSCLKNLSWCRHERGSAVYC